MNRSSSLLIGIHHAVALRCRAGFRAVAIGLMLIGLTSAASSASQPNLGYTKVLIGNRYLTAQPNATPSPAVVLLSGLDATIIDTYEETTLAAVHGTAVNVVRDRALAAQVEMTPRDDYDKVYVNGRIIDTRLGTRASLRGETLDAPYAGDEWGAWIIQFSGPIKPAWLEQLRSEGIVLVQYLPFNAFIAGARESMIGRAASRPFVQFVEQMHAFMKPLSGIATGESAELWIQAVTAEDTATTIALLESLSVRNVEVAAWSETETRIEGVFNSDDIARIARDPLVIAIAGRPTIAMSDERAALSLTNLPAGTGAGRYKKWLADLCESCGDLAGDGYYIGLADLGLDGGSGVVLEPAIANEPPASGSHRDDVPASRIVYGSSFEATTGPWTPPNQIPDSTGTKHDVIGHGTLVAAVAAGDPGPTGLTDSGGFQWGLGVAPSAGMLVTKINATRIATGVTLVEHVTKDARSHPTRIAYIQNHSYNQYNTAQFQGCDMYVDGYYSVLSRDFDQRVRDADPSVAGNQQIMLTVSAGNVSQQGYANDTSCHPRRYLTLPPATAKNVLALGMAENVRSDSASWNCYGALALSYDNIAGNTKTGTAIPGWYKPDLMAVAANIASVRSHDLATGYFTADYCQNQVGAPSLPSQYLSSTGTSFAAPAAAGAALLASRYFAARTAGGNASSASPALLKAMLIAGAKSMQGGLDRSRTRAWRPTTDVQRPVVYRNGELAVPRIPNGRLYIASTGQFGGVTGTTEPQWPSPGSSVQDSGISWADAGAAEPVVGSSPNDRQGFGRLNIADVLSTYPARFFVNQDSTPLDSGQAWTKSFKVHDGSMAVRVALVWTDPYKQIETGTFITAPPLVNNLNLSVELGTPCSGRYIGNVMPNEVSQFHQPCTAGSSSFDLVNNVEVIRFVAAAGSEFLVRVAATEGVSQQDFALVVYNAYDAGLPPPPATPTALAATATSPAQVHLTWNAVAGAASYHVQRSGGVNDPYVTLPNSPSTNSYTDNSVATGTSYLYRVRASNATSVSDYSNVDLATTVLFQDDPLIANTTVIREAHLTELRAAASAVRTAAALPNPYPWTDPTITAGSTPVRANHVIDLRLAIDQARDTLGLPNPPYADGILTPGSTLVRETHFRELRERTK